MEYALNSSQGSSRGFGGDIFGDDAVVRLRGLPFDAGKIQIADFFDGKICKYIFMCFPFLNNRFFNFCQNA